MSVSRDGAYGSELTCLALSDTAHSSLEQPTERGTPQGVLQVPDESHQRRRYKGHDQRGHSTLSWP
jgi:hypothetical protein